jgi:hypothetical protein
VLANERKAQCALLFVVVVNFALGLFVSVASSQNEIASDSAEN